MFRVFRDSLCIFHIFVSWSYLEYFGGLICYSYRNLISRLNGKNENSTILPLYEVSHIHPLLNDISSSLLFSQFSFVDLSRTGARGSEPADKLNSNRVTLYRRRRMSHERIFPQQSYMKIHICI